MVDLKTSIGLALVMLAVSVVYVTHLIWDRGFPLRIDTSFAEHVSLKYHYLDKAIDVEITDGNDINALKEMFAGPVWRDASLSCGFTKDTSITLSGGGKSIVFCPACDTCSNIRIYGTDRYVAISKEQRKRFDDIVKKYGMTFPCV